MVPVFFNKYFYKAVKTESDINNIKFPSVFLQYDEKIIINKKKFTFFN